MHPLSAMSLCASVIILSGCSWKSFHTISSIFAPWVRPTRPSAWTIGSKRDRLSIFAEMDLTVLPVTSDMNLLSSSLLLSEYR